MDMNTNISRKEGTVSTVIDDEVIILDFGSGEYFGLEGAAKELWLYLESGPASVNDVMEQWLKLFDNPEQEIHSLLMEAVGELEQLGLLESKVNVTEG